MKFSSSILISEKFRSQVKTISIALGLLAFGSSPIIGLANESPVTKLTIDTTPRFERPKRPMTKQILFICRGNFFRSRFAEAFFNYLSDQKSADWNAISRGTGVDSEKDRDGSVSHYATGYIQELKIPVEYLKGYPRQLQWEDISSSNQIIVTNRKQQRPALFALFPDKTQQILAMEETGQISYWNVEDAGSQYADGVFRLSQIRSKLLNIKF